MNYWLNLYTWTTWKECEKAGLNVTGFRKSKWSTVRQIRRGDIFLCYMTGISRFFALEEVTGEPFQSDEPIWQEEVFPCRVPIRVLLCLAPEHAIPVKSLGPQLSYFRNTKSFHAWTGHFRNSPIREEPEDARVVVAALQEAETHPVYHDFDARYLNRKVNVYRSKSGQVSIPDDEETDLEPEAVLDTGDEEAVTHEEIQWLLLYLGEQMGLQLWVASNDRGRSFSNQSFNTLTGLRSSLPVQFDEATNKTIELIDVLWLQGNSIIAAFEIEHTTSIHSGLLRMADLITMQPNIKIPLYIVAPDERRDKVEREINRPVFSKALKQPLPKICRYIPYSGLKQRVEQAQQGGFLRYLRPDYLDEIAENLELDD